MFDIRSKINEKSYPNRDDAEGWVYLVRVKCGEFALIRFAQSGNALF